MLKCLTLLLCLLVPLQTHAAPNTNDSITLTASVNKTVLTENDELKLTVTVEGAAGNFTPQLPSLPAFNIYARSTSRQINNFHAVSVFEYIMVPRMQGKTVIGPITLQYGDTTYKTEPISITVYRADAAPASAANGQKQTAKKTQKTNKPSQAEPAEAPKDLPPMERELYNLAARHTDEDYFMVAAVSDKNPFINQAVTLSVRVYYAHLFFKNAPYTAPSISNLFMEFVSSAEGSQTINGKPYRYIEQRYAISGVTAGAAQVGTATVKYIPMGNVNMSVFNRMFATVSGEPQTIQSNTVSLNIRSTPQKNKPKSFYGAVGSDYSISATLDRQEVEAGEAVNLTITVNGPGNLKTTSDLRLPSLAGFKVYDVVSNAGSVPNNGELKSYKIFKTVIVPISSGSYTIPAISWSYFDPSTKEYRTIRTKPMELKVTPSSKAQTGFDFGTKTDLGGGFRQLGQDIRYLKSELAQPEASFLSKLGRQNLISILFAALLFTCIVFALMDKKMLAGKRALLRAKAQLKNAWTEETVAEALSAYVQAKYGVHTASLTLREIVAALKKRGCPSDLVQRFETLWQRLDAARFAPVDLQGQGTEELARQAAELMKEMDKGGRP